MTDMTAETNPGFRTFLVVWAGQLVSLIGTNLTGFALAIWVYQETGSTTQLSFVLLATSLPQLLITPFAGALVDRWDRRWAMLLSDTGAGVGTIVIVVLLATDSLQIWHLYPILAVSGMFQAFQWPAYTAATTLLVSKENYGRAAGMVQLAEAIGQVIAPAVAGAILVLSGLEMVILIDVITFLFAIGTLLTVRFPPTPKTAAGVEGRGRLLDEARFGWDYIKVRRGLVGMLTWAAVINLLFGGLGVLIFPLILAFATEAQMGLAFSIAGIGMVAGSLVMSVWGGPKRRINGLYLSGIILGLSLGLVGLRPSI
ncbi:MAG: MFS transporter, partial [Acidimicrobiia bacterium]|nr:MFS transporter [Acidimicrobiia bacterium]